MDTKISIVHKVDLERMVFAESAEPTYLPLSLLQEITDNFSDDQQVGSGGFAMVYKGMVGKAVVAIKKLSKTLYMHENKFHKEVECLMKAKHKNVVRFLGYCSDTQGIVADYEGKFVMADLRNWLLCFEYVPNGTLDKYITDASRGLEWRERYQIVKGISEGLLHLHKQRILHLDLKPSNILIDDHMVPKIADFGQSRCLSEDQTRAFTSQLCGTQGYLAPEFYRGQFTFASDIYSLGIIIVEILTGEKGYPEEENISDTGISRLIVRGYEESGITIGDMAYMDPVYVRKGLLTEQSDVYSFGVIILELVTRRKATRLDKNSLVMKFLENHKQGRKSTELFDKEIAVMENLELLDTLAEIAVECLNHNVDQRPTMVDVARRLSMLN